MFFITFPQMAFAKQRAFPFDSNGSNERWSVTEDTGQYLSSFVVDMGLATKEDPHLLVDQAKVTREQEREMTRLIARAEEWMRSSGIDAILFDGRRCGSLCPAVPR